MRWTPWLPAALLLAGCRIYEPSPVEPRREAESYAARSLTSPRVTGLRQELLGAQQASESWDASSLTVAALAFRAGIAVAAAGARRSEAALETAGARRNPTLSLVPEYTASGQSGTSPWSPAALLGWTVETAGKRGHRSDQARARALSARYALRAEVARAHAEIAQALLAHSLLLARVASLSAQAGAADTLAELWRRRVDVGAASLAECMPREAARLDAARALAAQRTAEAEALGVAAAAVGVPVDALRRVAVRPPDEVELSLWARLERSLALERALTSRSDVLGALADYAAAESALALEIARQYPDVVLGPGYQWDRGDSRWQLGITLELPLLDHNEGPIAEAEAARMEAAARFRETQARAIAQIEAALLRRDGFAAARAAARVFAAERARDVERARRAIELGAGTRADALTVQLEALRAEQAEAEAEWAWRGALIELATALEAVPFEAGPFEAWLDEQIR